MFPCSVAWLPHAWSIIIFQTWCVVSCGIFTWPPDLNQWSVSTALHQYWWFTCSWHLKPMALSLRDVFYCKYLIEVTHDRPEVMTIRFTFGSGSTSISRISLGMRKEEFSTRGEIRVSFHSFGKMNLNSNTPIFLFRSKINHLLVKT